MDSSALASTKLAKVTAEIDSGNQLTRIDLSNEGLHEFPSVLYKVKNSLELLNMGGNNLSSLPEDITDFKKLRIMFFANNRFKSIPTQLGLMVSLYMLSFKSNNIHTIPAESLSPSIGWLILTDNHIEELPSSIGCLSKLRKCMLAGNRLTTLPDEMQQCTEIELLRLSANRLTNLPQWLLKLPKLSWLAYSGNDIATKRADVKDSEAIINSGIPSISWSDLTMEQQLGEGASGNVYRALWQKKDAPTALSASSPALSGDDGNAMGTSIFRSMGDAREGSAEGGGSSLSGISGSHLEVAVKLFKGEKTSDGLPEDEMKITEAVGNHPNLIGVFGRLTGTPNNQLGLVLPLVALSRYSILGNPPSFDTVTRDTFSTEQQSRLTLSFILRVLTGIASACAHLHHASCSTSTATTAASAAAVGRTTRGIMHGDLYAHNILVDDVGHALLTDFGAATFKEEEEAFSTGTASLGSALDSTGTSSGQGAGMDEDMTKEQREEQEAHQGQLLERIEVRAFGCLLDDLLTQAHLQPGAEATSTSTASIQPANVVVGDGGDGGGGVVGRSAAHKEVLYELLNMRISCMLSDVPSRPCFRALHQQLSELLQGCQP